MHIPVNSRTRRYCAVNLSLHEGNKSIISKAGAVKSLICVLKTGTETSKQNAACTLLNLALVDKGNKLSIGACGAIPPLVSLLINGATRRKKDALTTLYKQATGLAEKAMVVLSSLVGIELGRVAIVEEGGIAAFVEAIEDGSDKGKEFAVLTLLYLCGDSVRNRGLLVRDLGKVSFRRSLHCLRMVLPRLSTRI